jgi:hypothetical protein
LKRFFISMLAFAGALFYVSAQAYTDPSCPGGNYTCVSVNGNFEGGSAASPPSECLSNFRAAYADANVAGSCANEGQGGLIITKAPFMNPAGSNWTYRIEGKCSGAPWLTGSGPMDFASCIGATSNPTAPTITAATVSFTPTLSFGNSSSGIIYSVQEGDYFYDPDSNLVIGTISVYLTSKGTATGAARISLPYPVDTSQPVGGFGNAMSSYGSLVGVTDPSVAPWADGLELLTNSGGTTVYMTNANVSNGTYIRATFWYFAAPTP